jgi:hypothetical protein
MIVLLLAVLLLVVAPALLLGLGHAIDAIMSGRFRRSADLDLATSATGDEWYRRKMRPAFTRNEEDDGGPLPAP